MEDLANKAIEHFMLYGVNILVAVLIFVIGKRLAVWGTDFLANLMRKGHIDEMLVSFTRNIVYVALLIFISVAALGQLGVQTTSFVAVIGAAGLAVGLALQGSLANFAAGVVLILLKPFKVGDFIEAGGASGTVQGIQIFNTILKAPDNRTITVPNSKITGDNITNITGIDRRRVDLLFSISYGDDMKKAKEVLMDLVSSDPRVLKDPPPVVAVWELADSSVDLVCRPWVKPADYWQVRFDIIENGKLKLEEAGMVIPFPQQDVHLIKE